MIREYTVRPLSAPIRATGVLPNFDTKWGATRDLLFFEADKLGCKRIILECDVDERHIRIDGQLRADARPRSSAIAVVLLGTAKGDLRFQANLEPGYTSYRESATWQENVRAIALTLEALRKVERYGTTPTAEQYSGFRQLASGSGPTASRGSEIVAAEGSLAAALRATHPDTRDEGSAYTDNDFASVQAFKEGR